MNSKVSIGMPVYNAARDIREAVESLLSQDYSNFELIISDNASTDETEEICRAYANRDPRVSYQRADQNYGAVWNFKNVFDLSSGEYFMWAAHDDLWHPHFVRSCVEALENNLQAVLCHSYAQPITLTGQTLGSPYIGYDNTEPTARLRWRRTMQHWELHAAIYGLMRRDVVAKVRPLLSCMSSDLIFIAELVLHGQIIQVPETLSWKRMPVSLKDYRTPEETLKLLGHSGRLRRLRLVRLAVMLECLRGLSYSKIEPQLHRQIYWDSWLMYFTDGSLLNDLKELIAMRLGVERYQRLTQPVKAALGKDVTIEH